MALKFKGIGHVAIRCKNYKEQFEFYTKIFGFKKILDIYDENGEIWITYLRVRKGQYIELFHKTMCHPHNFYIGENKQVDRSPFNVGYEVEDQREITDNVKLENEIGLPCGNIVCEVITDLERNEWELIKKLKKN